MKMQMFYRLHSVLAAVVNQAVTVFQAQLLCDVFHLHHEIRDQLGVLRLQVVQR